MCSCGSVSWLWVAAPSHSQCTQSHEKGGREPNISARPALYQEGRKCHSLSPWGTGAKLHVNVLGWNN